MSSSSSTSTLLLLFFLFISSSHAFNITKILEDHSEFSSFNDLLSKTKLADQINKRETITVLAVDNGAVSYLSGLSEDDAKNTLSLHVVLDYYDTKKLERLNNKSTILTTLFQASGEASGQKQGFINATVLSSGDVAFGPAAPDSTLNSNLIKSVASQPYNVSVLQVSSVIGSSNSTAPSYAPMRSPKKAPAPKHGAEAPVHDESPSDAPSEEMSPSDAPTPSPMDSSPPEPGAPTDNSPPSPDDAKEGSASGAAPGAAIFGSSSVVILMVLWPLLLLVL
ncbi:hypothetical protein Patl1_34840 [Pistacia atlantica]|uniref:Uncharacterized protein n=1 Tax=Pistacia atlantica TaxID=434234 RepID=A0ACC0ZVM3_9ROSI|nr:hypothetical protein Patl1_34840 [Pistacia atlantica]